MAPAGSAVGPGNVSVGLNGGPVFSEAPVAGPLAPVLTYNGGALDSDAGVSPGWFFTYGETLVSDWPGRLVWTDSSGFRRYYSGSDPSGYVAFYPGDALGTVSRSGSDYVLALPDGTRRTFVALSGYWKSTVDRWGSGAQGNTTAASRATVVQELLGGATTGRQISLGYTSGQLTSVTDTALGVTQFGYDASARLSTVCTADLTCPWRTFGYHDTTARVVSISDPAGSVLRGYSWDPDAGVSATWVGASTFAAGKERTTFTPSSSTVIVSRYVDGVSTSDTVYNYEAIAGVNRITQISGACPECGAENSTSTFDPSTGRLLTRVNGNGFLSRFQYDAYGNLERLTEAEGTAVARTTIWDFAVPGVDPLPASWPSTVRDFWKLKTEPSGAKAGSFVETSRSFDGVGNLVLNETVLGFLSSADSTAASRSTETTFDSHGHPVLMDGPRNDVADVTVLEYYDASYPVALRDRLKRRLEPDQTETTFDSYHALGGVSQETQRLRSGASDADVVTEYTYDARGRLLSRTLKATAVTESDLVTTNGYDSRGRLSFTQVQPVGGPVTTRTNLTYENGTDRLLTRTLTTTAGGPGDRITYGYDDRGNTTSESYGVFNGSTTTVDWIVTRAFDGRCRVKSQTYPADNATTTYDYDCVGNLTQVKDSLHTVPNLIYSYDGRNRLKSVTRKATPADDLTTYDYDVRDQVTKVTDPNGAETHFAFDDFGSVRRRTTALSGGGYSDVTSYGYDDAGNLSSESNAVRGTTRIWDAAGRLLAVTSAVGSPTLSTTHTYDLGCDPDPVSGHVFGQGRLCSVVDESGVTTFAYDRRGLITSQQLAVAASEVSGVVYGAITYRHDAAGRRVEVAYDSGERIQSILDGAGRVTTIVRVRPTGPAEELVSSITHKPFGPVSGFVTYGGTTESRTFDSRYRRMSQSVVSGGVTRISLAYGDGSNSSTAWDKEGNLLSIRDLSPGSGTAFDRTFQYDPARYFLTSATGPFGPSWTQQTLTWLYDGSGNRLEETRSGVGTTTYGYGSDGSGHSNGVLTAITPPGSASISLPSWPNGDLRADDDGLNYEYDALGRLTRISAWSLGAGTYPNESRNRHDFRNLRVIRTSRAQGSSTRPTFFGWHYLFDNDGKLVFESRRLPGGLSGGTWIYVWLEGEPVAVLAAPWERGSGRLRYYLHNDHLGRPIGMTDDAGALRWRPEYEPFGRTLGQRVDDLSGPGFRFPGQWESEESGDLKTGKPGLLGRIGALTDNWHRTYFQRWGRYSQPDPLGNPFAIKDGLYAYVVDNPLSLVDPLGLSPCGPCCQTESQRAADRERILRDVNRALFVYGATHMHVPQTQCETYGAVVSTAIAKASPRCFDWNDVFSEQKSFLGYFSSYYNEPAHTAVVLRPCGTSNWPDGTILDAWPLGNLREFRWTEWKPTRTLYRPIVLDPKGGGMGSCPSRP